VEGEGAPATQVMGTAGRWGKTERRSRATHSAHHIGRGWTMEGDRRRRAVCNRGGLEWRRWELGEERGRCLGVRGEAESGASPFYRRGKAVLGLGQAREAHACLQPWRSGQLAVMAADGM
jgi:hypothetical protein